MPVGSACLDGCGLALRSRQRRICQPPFPVKPSCPLQQARELEELAQIYVERGLPVDLARQVG